MTTITISNPPTTGDYARTQGNLQHVEKYANDSTPATLTSPGGIQRDNLSKVDGRIAQITQAGDALLQGLSDGGYKGLYATYADFSAALSTLADGIYRITQDEQLQADEGLSFAPASARVVAGGVVTGTENLSNVPYANGNNSAVRTVQERLQEVLYVEDFRASGDSDAQVWQKAVNEMAARKAWLKAGSRVYEFDTHVTVSGGFCKIDFGTCEIRNVSTTHPKISTPTTPDTSYPDNLNPGPMRGCAFYFTTLIYSSEFFGGIFTDFRFAFAFLGSHNGAFFNLNSFLYCNCGIICYQGSQHYIINSARMPGSGVLFIAGATCFPSGSPYSGQDNYYCDGFQCKNELTYVNVGAVIHSDFDIWFRDSILRPTTGSYNIAASNYVSPYDIDDDRAKPTGRLVYIPMRNQRDVYSPLFIRLRIQNCPRGFALIDGAVTGMLVEQCVFEGFEGPHFLQIGSTGNISDSVLLNQSAGSETQPFLSFTGVPGRAHAERLVIIGGDDLWQTFTDQYGVSPTVISRRGVKSYSYTINAPLDAMVSTEGSVNFKYAVAPRGIGLALPPGPGAPREHDWNAAITLPVYSSTSGLWKNVASFNPGVSSMSGVLTLDVVDTETGETDCGVYQIIVPDEAITSVTLAADANNGDTTITINGPSSMFMAGIHHLMRFAFSGVTVVVKSVSGNVLTLAGPIVGLLATAPSGTPLTQNISLKVLHNMQRRWVYPLIRNNNEIAIRRHDQPETDIALNGTVFRVFARFHTYLGGRVGVVHSANAPATGKWEKGATVYTAVDAPSTLPVLERTCVSSGTPGTWKASKWHVNVGPTSARPALTSSDIGVMHMDTTLASGGKPIWWTGNAWVDSAGTVV